MTDSAPCPCDPTRSYKACCGKFIDGFESPHTPEQLMRSRFSAYALDKLGYVLETYSTESRGGLSLADLQDHQIDTCWQSLQIVHADTENDTVEFRAYYTVDSQWYVMHEKSTFVKEENKWRYQSGVIYDDSGRLSPGRNDLCPCGSGKKFKKCCGK